MFDFGKRGALVDAAKHASLATNLNFNLMHQKIIHDVSVAYFSYGAAQKKSEYHAKCPSEKQRYFICR
nr:TolC family protein [Shigella sp. FC1967]